MKEFLNDNLSDDEIRIISTIQRLEEEGFDAVRAVEDFLDVLEEDYLYIELETTTERS